MDIPDKDRVRDVQGNWQGSGSTGTPTVPSQEKQYRAKVFKSGNSLALRLPKELGLVEGSVMTLRRESGGFRLELQAAPKPRLDISGFWGKAPGLVPPPRLDFEERPSKIARSKAQKSK